MCRACNRVKRWGRQPVMQSDHKFAHMADLYFTVEWIGSVTHCENVLAGSRHGRHPIGALDGLGIDQV